MFYLIWEMGILLLLAVGFGVFVGYQLWSGDARSAEADAAIAENARLRQENENLARRLGEASSQSRSAAAETPRADQSVAREPAPAAATPVPTPATETKSGLKSGTKAETRAMPETKAEAKPATKAEAKPEAKPPAKAKPTAKATAKSPPVAKAATSTKAAGAKTSSAKAAVAKPASGEDLSVIKGLGPKAAAALKAGGITSVAQIAAWTEADIERWDAAINGRGRILRDDWVGQAKTLAG
jgi:NADH-quinone oxidoreductase subunit E